MKKTLITFSILLLISCNKYEKDAIVSQTFKGETYYYLRIFENYTFFNHGAIKIYELKENQINEKNIDSVNFEADRFIELLNKKID